MLIQNNIIFRRRLLTITLFVNYCGSLYLTISNDIVGRVIAGLTLALSLVHAGLYVCFNRYQKKTIQWIIGYCIIFVAYRYCRRREILDLYTYVSFYSSEDSESINDTVLNTTIIFFVTTVFLCFAHIIPDAPLFLRGDTVRYTLGLNHPNAGGYYLYIIAGAYFFKSYRKPKGRGVLLLYALSVCSILIFNCRTSYIGILIIASVYALKKVRINSSECLLAMPGIRHMLSVAVVFFTFLTIGISMHYWDSVYLNHLFETRLENTYYFLQNYDIKLLGNAQVPEWHVVDGWSKRYLDSGYIQCLLKMGILNFLIYALFFGSAVEKSIQQRQYATTYLLIIIALRLLVEASPLRWYFAIPLLYTNYGKMRKKKESVNSLLFYEPI